MGFSFGGVQLAGHASRYVFQGSLLAVFAQLNCQIRSPGTSHLYSERDHDYGAAAIAMLSSKARTQDFALRGVFAQNIVARWP